MVKYDATADYSFNAGLLKVVNLKGLGIFTARDMTDFRR